MEVIEIKQDIIRQTFIKKVAQELINENIAIFAGAGLSIPAGMIDWRSLVEPFAQELGLQIEKENDLVSLMQYYSNEKNGRHEISQAILDNFSSSSRITENHKILARLPIKTYWTTNYDSLIEDALEKEGKIVDVKYTLKQLPLTKNKRDAIIYKMHGDKNHSSDAIILKDDYESYFLKYGQFIDTLKGDLISKTFIFIGFSFTDPNLEYILSRIRVAYEKDQRTHYCFLKKIHNNEYEQLKQEYFIKDLKRFGIEVILVQEYEEITDILKKIEEEINKNNIFISGSAESYLPFNEREAKVFINNLSKKLIEDGKNIITGFGLGVGGFVINGALEHIYMNNKRIENDRLIMRPFPQETVHGDLKEMWQKYREDMISRAGIIIIVFGNKKDDKNNIILANGVYSEYEIAKKLNKIIIPVGATGFMAKQIWDEMKNLYDDSSDEIRKLFLKLDSEEKPENIVNVISDFIKIYKK